jgi:phytoene dehydrogenase-like protein
VSHDAIVIGAGINGLVAAHALRRAGRKVVVLEQHTGRDAAPDTGWIPPAVIKELALERAGLAVRRADPWCVAALPDGGRLELSRDVARTQAALARLSPKDAQRWPEFAARLRRLGTVLEELYTQPAPDVETTKAGELFRLGLLGLNVRRRGRQATIDLLRTLPMSAWELLDEWFESDALKAALATAAVRHLFQGPRSGGTAFNLLHHHAGCEAGVFRQPESNIGAVLEGLPGVELRRGAKVARITVKAERVTGVVLANGDEIAAPLVLSGADPRATMIGLLEPGWLDPEFVRAVRNIKCRGIAARVELTLDAPAPFTTLTVAPSLTYVERAFDDAKYGRVASEPWIEANADGTTVRAHVQFVPHQPQAGWDDAARRALGDTVIRKLAEAGARCAVRGTRVMAPADLAAQGLTEGHAYHGEHTLDQILFMRPVPGWSRYATPIAGLFLAGPGTHPGGGVLGMSGLLAARAALRSAT